MIVLVNYGLGNIRAFENIYKRLNVPVRVANSADELADAEKIILPGVGAFDGAMSMLQASGMRECLDDLVLNKETFEKIKNFIRDKIWRNFPEKTDDENQNCHNWLLI